MTRPFYELVSTHQGDSRSQGYLRTSEHAGRFFLELENQTSLRMDMENVVRLRDMLDEWLRQHGTSK